MRDIELIRSDELKQAKQQSGLSDGELARAVATARQTISGLLNGKQGSLVLLVAVCRVMGLDYREFLRPVQENATE